MLIKVLKPYFSFNDERGNLIQLMDSGYNQMNFITSKANIMRGNHYHKFNKEVFYMISGKIEVSVQKINSKTGNLIENTLETYSFNKGDMFEIMPNINHIIYYIEATEMISLYDKGVENSIGDKDIWTPNDLLKSSN